MAAKISLRDYQRDLAERMQSADSGRGVSKLGMQVGDERWLVDLKDAAEVIPVPPISPVPLTHPWFRGVANIRGNLYSVVDFAAFLGANPAPIAEQARLLLLSERFRMASALLIDRSLGLRNPEQFQPRPGVAARSPWVLAELADELGVAWTELDVSQLVQHAEFLSVAA